MSHDPDAPTASPRTPDVHAAYERFDLDRARIESEIRAVMVEGPAEDLGRALRAERLAVLYRDLAAVIGALELAALDDLHCHPIYVDVIVWARRGAEMAAEQWDENAREWRAEMVESARRVGRQNAMLAGLGVDGVVEP